MNRIQIIHTEEESMKRRAALEVDPVFPVGLHGQPDPEATLRRMLAYAEFLVALDGDEPAGLAVMYANNEETRTAYITLFGMKPAYQRQGLGKELLAACEALARARGMERIRLEVTDSNVKAVRFYTRAGFVRTGTCEENSSYMEKNIAKRILTRENCRDIMAKTVEEE